MKYVIYQMVQPSHLKEIELDGYYQKTVYRDILEKLDVGGVEETHTSMESANSEIIRKAAELKNLRLTVLPVYDIDYDGEIR